ncbi:MAG: DNA polymerase V [Oleiphilaceae bacterium]|jgi:DNA polymerase V
MYALVDCNAFFASCEQVFRPDLRGKPVVVLSNNDGCIVARSKEAKALNIPDLVPYFKVKPLLEKYGVHVFSSNYELYGDLSNRVMKALEYFSPDIEVYSIDEAFLSLVGLQTKLPRFGHEIKDRVFKHTGMAVGVGIAPTKTLAKLASHIAKKSAKCDYVCVIEQIAPWYKVFSKIPVNKVWGIGGRIAKRLSDSQIFTVYDLMRQDSALMKKRYNVNVARTIDELNGIKCYQLEQAPEPKKQIFSTRSFGQKIIDCHALEQSVSQYASRACVKLRQQKQRVKTITIFASSAHFIGQPYSRSVVIQLPMPTNDSRTIISAARYAIRTSIYREGIRFSRAGVGLIELYPELPEQLDAFTPIQTNASRQLMIVMDEINKKHSKVFFASQGIDQKWRMNRNLKSPGYTTKWADLPLIRL